MANRKPPHDDVTLIEDLPPGKYAATFCKIRIDEDGRIHITHVANVKPID